MICLLQVDTTDRDDLSSNKSAQDTSEVEVEDERNSTDDNQYDREDDREEDALPTPKRTPVSTKLPTKIRYSAAAKRARKEEQESIVLDTATECMSQLAKRMTGKPTPPQKEIQDDDDDIFGEFIAREMRNISSSEAKRRVKFRIHQVLFEAAAVAPYHEGIRHSTYQIPGYYSQRIGGAYMGSYLPTYIDEGTSRAGSNQMSSPAKCPHLAVPHI